jgi:hypothetical protein
MAEGRLELWNFIIFVFQTIPICIVTAVIIGVYGPAERVEDRSHIERIEEILGSTSSSGAAGSGGNSNTITIGGVGGGTTVLVNLPAGYNEPVVAYSSLFNIDQRPLYFQILSGMSVTVSLVRLFYYSYTTFYSKERLNIAKYSSRKSKNNNRQLALPYATRTGDGNSNGQLMIGNGNHNGNHHGSSKNNHQLMLANGSDAGSSPRSSPMPSPLTEVNVEEQADVNSRHFRRKMLALEMTPKNSGVKIRASPHSPKRGMNGQSFPREKVKPGSPVRKMEFEMPKG